MFFHEFANSVVVVDESAAAVSDDAGHIERPVVVVTAEEQLDESETHRGSQYL